MAENLPAFEVEELEGTILCKRMTYNPELGMKEVEKEEPAGFMVYFPNGHSFRVRTKEELIRLGLGYETEDGELICDPALIDMESGEIIPKANMTLKERVRRKTKQSRGRNRMRRDPNREVEEGSFEEVETLLADEGVEISEPEPEVQTEPVQDGEPDGTPDLADEGEALEASTNVSDIIAEAENKTVDLSLRKDESND